MKKRSPPISDRLNELPNSSTRKITRMKPIDSLTKDGETIIRITTAFGDRLEDLSLIQKRRALALISLSSLGYSMQMADHFGRVCRRLGAHTRQPLPLAQSTLRAWAVDVHDRLSRRDPAICI
jgi:hypothetical protein